VAVRHPGHEPARALRRWCFTNAEFGGCIRSGVRYIKINVPSAFNSFSNPI
jgi:hypothetical protein